MVDRRREEILSVTRFLRKLPKGQLASRDKGGGRGRQPILLEDGTPFLLEAPGENFIALENT